ncbi:MAG: D-alanine--D-alanine ligase [Bacteroidales bacterium]
MRKKVALVYGGDSSEYEISIKSAKHIAKHIDTTRYEVWEVLIKGAQWDVLPLFADLNDPNLVRYPIEKSDFSFSIPNRDGGVERRVKFDVVLIMIHGTPGENGLFQAYLEMIGIPFTTSSAAVALLAFNKYACKSFLRGFGVTMPKDLYLKEGDPYDPKEIVKKLGLPLFVKPNNGGSSFGASKVESIRELSTAIDYAFKEDSAILIEEYIEGREVTNGVFNDILKLPVTEIIPHNQFFDYEAKYLGASDEICPAPIDDELRDKIIEVSHSIYRYLNCKGFVRIDYIVRNNHPYFLEINTVPGMTEMSLIPQQIRAVGLSIEEFLNLLLN